LAARASAEAFCEKYNTQARGKRLDYLEAQATEALRAAVEKFEHPVLPCALIASDVVTLHLLHKASLLDQGTPSLRISLSSSFCIRTDGVLPQGCRCDHRLRSSLCCMAAPCQWSISGRWAAHAVKVVFIDTLHLFDETTAFLSQVENTYGFKALHYTPKDFKTASEYQAVHGLDLPIRDIEQCASRSCKCSETCAFA
jgi:phosphoadenosine phosphosulfate reductase